jgi:hypothetical protein
MKPTNSRATVALRRAPSFRRCHALSLIAQIIAAAEAVEVSNALLERRLADALAINVACDLPPPFGLLQVVETLGLGPLHPESTSPLGYG